MPTKPFSARYAGYSDEQLLEIVYHTQDYVPDAVLAANGILHSRGLDPFDPVNMQRHETWKSQKVLNPWEWIIVRLKPRPELSPDVFIPRPIIDDRRHSISLSCALWFMVALLLYLLQHDLLDLLASFAAMLSGNWLLAIKALPIGLGVLVLYLLLSMNRWGWIIGFTALTALMILSLWTYIDYGTMLHGTVGGTWFGTMKRQPTYYLLEAGLDLSAVIHFLRREVRSAFRTSGLPMAWIFFGALACFAIYALSKLA